MSPSPSHNAPVPTAQPPTMTTFKIHKKRHISSEILTIFCLFIINWRLFEVNTPYLSFYDDFRFSYSSGRNFTGGLDQSAVVTDDHVTRGSVETGL